MGTARKHIYLPAPRFHLDLPPAKDDFAAEVFMGPCGGVSFLPLGLCRAIEGGSRRSPGSRPLAAALSIFLPKEAFL